MQQPHCKFSLSMHIAIAGNIGSGKTTLTKLLSKHYGYRALFESTDNNPYINSFYEDMRRWSFNLQIYFLHTRIRQMMEIKDSGADFVQDRTIFEDACIFAPNLHGQGMMSDRDFDNYKDLFDLMISLVKLPDLMIYIRASIPTLVAQIQKRGREYEQTMRLDYLQGFLERGGTVENYEKNSWTTGGFNPNAVVGDSTWSNSDNTYKIALQDLEEIIQLAKNKKITVVGVVFPQSPYFIETGSFGRHGMKRSTAIEVLKEIAKLETTYSNFVFMDENKMGSHDYPDSFAYDYDHLNIFGAEVITERIDSAMFSAESGSKK